MQQRQNSEVENRLHRLAYSSAPGELADNLYDEVKGMVDTGYPRAAMYEDLEHLALELRRDGHDELEDDVIDVANVLVGWCGPSVQL